MSGNRLRSRASKQYEGLPGTNEEQGFGNDSEYEPSFWTQEEAKRFFEAFQEHNTDWGKVSRAVRSKSPESCDALYRSFRSFLSLPKQMVNVKAFLAVVKDSLKLEDTDADTISDNHSEPSNGGDSGKEMTPAARGRRAAQTQLKGNSGAEHKSKSKDKVWDARSSPVWGTRRPRARQVRASHSGGQQSPSPGRGQSTRGQHLAEMGDAEGIDALLSLAAVAQEASYGDNQDQGRGDGRPMRMHRKPKRHIEETEDDLLQGSPRGARTSSKDIYSPPSRQRARPAGRARSPAVEPLPPRTPSSRSKREKPKPASAKKGEGGTGEAGRRDANDTSRNTEASASKTIGSESGLRHSSRTRRRTPKDVDEDYEVRPTPKKSRKLSPEESKLWDDELQEADLEAEKEDLEDEEEDFDWSKRRSVPMPRRRRRKSAPEKPPPMMASAKALFARRSSLTFSAPPPAFLLGVPPANAQMNGVETAGQKSMGPAELRMRHCLDPKVRRWTSYEFFCSAVDRPWLMRNELADYLSHVGIPQGTRLTRPELAIIRASLGRPRRLSLSYLRQERIKLEAWRERVRAKYAELGPGVEVPSNYPRQLQVGQKVTARHPITRQLHDGDVLTVASNSYRVQFERRELGVELIKDINVMPSDPTECLPAAVLQAKPQILLNGRQPGKASGRSTQAMFVSQPGWVETASKSAADGLQQGTLPSSLQVPIISHDLSDMNAALDMKEMLLARLKRLNDEVDAGMHKEEGGQRPEAFQKAYAQVLVDLQAMNKLLDSLPKSKPASSQPLPLALPSPSLQPIAQPLKVKDPVAPTAVVPTGQTREHEEASDTQVWMGLWREAVEMVDGVRARMASAEVAGEDITDPAASRSSTESGQNREQPATRVTHSKDVAPGELEKWNPSGVAGCNTGTEEDRRVSNLVAGCVSLLLALQTLSEKPRLASAADVAIDNALLALKPCTTENTPLYDGILRSVGTLKAHLRAEIHPA